MISADQKHVLIARRPSNVDHGGLWEFPGGKLAPYETGLEGLKRELHEELGVEIVRAQPLIRVHHEYPDKHILLDVWCMSLLANRLVVKDRRCAGCR
ncbi:hypothetical protein HAALTHF_32640n [Vreelandella aquamarina]|nr:hypothetical protein HAALTHF_32640n [Halomonas axialensis]